MSTQKQSRKLQYAVIIIALLIAVCAAAFALYHFIRRRTPASGSSIQIMDDRMEGDLARLSEETYNSVFLTMHSAEGFSEEDFSTYRGLDTVVASHTILGTNDLSQYLSCILGSGNAVTNLYLCLDPELLWADAGEKTDAWTGRLSEGLYSYIEKNPGITFEIMLPYPCLDYWLDLYDKNLDTILTLYHTLVNELSVYPNTKVFFPGFEYWLMVNPDNYSGSYFDANGIVTRKLFLYTFCDGVYRITPENENLFWDSLREIIAREKSTPTQYPDLSDRCFVLFGDSIFAYAEGSYSIPGYITGLSGALVYNYAVSGTCAALRENLRDFPVVVSDFFAENVPASDSGCLFAPDGIAVEGKKLCFVFNYGFNDYFDGCLIDDAQDPYSPASYKGSLRSGISKLQASFPDADYVIVSPTHTVEFENGTAVIGRGGTEGLPSYVKAAEEIADELGIYFIDNYNNFIITDETLSKYISDGTHPNESGRLVLAARLMYFVDEKLNPQP